MSISTLLLLPLEAQNGFRASLFATRHSHQHLRELFWVVVYFSVFFLEVAHKEISDQALIASNP